MAIRRSPPIIPEEIATYQFFAMDDQDKTSSPVVVRWGIRVTGALAALMGAFFLAIWLVGVGNQLSVRGIIIPKTNMALGQLFAGLSLLLLAPKRADGFRRLAGALFSVVVLLFGALTLGEHAFGWDLGIDQLLATEVPGVARTASPNRMGPPGALSLTLLGLGLLALALRRPRIVSYLGLVVCVIVLIPAVGFLYGINPFYGKAHVTGIAWPTVVALLALGSGLVLARSDSGPVMMLLRRDAGGALLRQLLPGAVLIPLALGFLHVQGEYRNLYSGAMGAGILVLALILVFSGMLWRSAVRLSRAASAQGEAEEELQSLTLFPSENPSPVMRISADGALLYANAASKDFMACRGGESSPILPDNLVAAAANALDTGAVGELEVDCGDKTFSFILAPIANRGYINLYGRDITDRKRVEQTLREAQGDLKHAQAVAHVGSWRLDVRRNELIWSDESYRIFGVPEGTPLTYGTFLASVHPDDREYVDQKWTAALRGEPYDVEHRIVVGDTIKWVRERAELEFDQQGQLRGGFGTSQDITERKAAEERERELEAHKLDFYRRTILAATSGKLMVTEQDEIEGIAGRALATWQVTDVSALADIRRAAAAMAEAEGIDHERLNALTSCIGEMLSNALKHALGGTASLHQIKDGLMFVVGDQGPGIDAINLPNVALVTGYSTAGTGGLGYKLMLACADQVYLATGPNGTTVAVEIKLQSQNTAQRDPLL
ncbi:MAG: ATP-binding protein [Armatimonadetes bacterium]|nr:ATP-binding protein [Armatimonadota bacterium]